MELASRMQIEADFRRAFAGLSSKHARELRRLLGDPPDLSNVPLAFWDRVEDEQRKEMALWILYAFLQSARQHGERYGLEYRTARDAAERWATGQVNVVLLGYIEHSKELLMRMGPTKRDVEDTLQQIFGEDRADKMASTQITAAQTAGSEYALGVFGLQSASDVWFTQADERVCAYCGPLHLQPRSKWRDIYYQQILPANPGYSVYGPPTGSPAHVRCRCFIQYAVESVSSGVAA